VVFNQDLGKLATPRSATTHRRARYVLRRLMIDRTTVSAIAVELGVSWHTVNTIAMGATTPRNRRIRHRHHRPDTGA
jgi:transposase